MSTETSLRVTNDPDYNERELTGGLVAPEEPENPELTEESMTVEERSQDPSEALEEPRLLTIIEETVRRPAHISKRRIARTWIFEVLTMALAIMVSAALVILLAIRNGKSPKFSSTNISLNTVVAALSTVASGCYTIGVGSVMAQYGWRWFTSRQSRSHLDDMDLFTEAANGAWGSAKLLWRKKHHLSFITVGALLTILTLGFDIFTQQLVGLQSISEPVQNSTKEFIGTAPRINQYTDVSYMGNLGGKSQKLLVGAQLKLSGNTPSTDMISAIFSGLMGTPAPSFTIPCATGNCTWPSIPTLGVCGECRNLTFQTNCSTGEKCNITTESGTSMTYTSSFSDGVGKTFLLSAFGLSDTALFYNQSSTSTAYLAVFDVISVAPESSSWENTTASECALWACLQEYHIASELGNQQENLTSTWSEVTVDAFASQDATFQNIPSSWNIIPGELYTIGYAAIQGLMIELGDILTASITLQETDAEYEPTEPYLQVVWNLTRTDIDSWIGNFANQMTFTMRNNYLKNSNETVEQFYAGSMFKNETVVQVAWYWMIPITIIVLVSALYLLLGIVLSYHSGVGAWKNNLLTMLFTKTDPELSEQVMGHSGSSDEIRKAVGARVALLELDDDEEWIFRLKDAW